MSARLIVENAQLSLTDSDSESAMADIVEAEAKEGYRRASEGVDRS